MDLENINCSKKEKEKIEIFIKNHSKEEFEDFYTNNYLEDICSHFNLTKEEMRIVRSIYDIKNLCKRKPRTSGTNKGKHYYTNGIDQIMLKDTDDIPDGYLLGRPPFSEETKKRISESKKGKYTHTHNAKSYTNGEIDIYLHDGDIIPEGFIQGSKTKGCKAYNNGIKVIYLKDDDIIPEGFTLGGISNKDKCENSVKSRKSNIERFKEDNNYVSLVDVINEYGGAWLNDKELLNSIDIIKHKGYKYISKDKIDLIKNFKAPSRVDTRLKHIREFEIENNCTCVARLIEKYGQLGIFKDLIDYYCYNATFISNNKLNIIEDYYKNCSVPYSNEEKEVLDYLRSIYNGEIKDNCRDLIVNPETGRHLEIDIYIPEKNLGIEYDGIYWHKEYQGEDFDKRYHFKKSKLAEDLGIRLIHIYSDEWKYKKDKIKQLLRIAIGKVDNIIYARNCSIRIISNKEAEPFSNKTHLQGHRDASITYGLFYKDELVQLMSFSKTANAKRNGAEWEIIRGCPGSNNIVVGGVSKLFKHFVKENSPKSVFSYCDYNKFNGNSYNKLGMEFIGFTGPDKYWIIDNKLVPRNPKKYKELKDKATGVLWGSGSKKYIWFND